MDVTKKKVGLFLRVSTAQQASNAKDTKEADLPTQRAACMRIIATHNDWELHKEYVEVGSAYKNSIENRDKLLEAISDIENGIIDVFFCFMFDRIGRISSETPFVVQKIVKMGVEVWSANEGQRTFNNDVDELLNYITFWQAAGESKKTSIRVTETMTELARQGEYIGGRPPYGYRRVVMEGTTKKGLPKHSFAVDEKEAEVVRLMYHLSASRNYGCHRIAVHLNEQGILTRSGKQWGNASISNILRNPIYKGFKAYNRTTAKGKGGKQVRIPKEQWTLPDSPNPDWIIVPQDIWEEVQEMKDTVIAAQKKQQEHNLLLPGRALGRSKLLFIGYIYCGCCGSKMQTGYSPYRWRTADGVLHRRDNPVYKCGGRASGKLGCGGKSSYKQEYIEGLVLDELQGYMDRLEHLDLKNEVERVRKENTSAESKRVKTLKTELKRLDDEISGLKDEVIKSVMGKSPFDKSMLNSLIAEREVSRNDVLMRLKQAKWELRQKELGQSDLTELQEMIPVWREVFENAGLDEKKVMLSKVIHRITVEQKNVEIEISMTFGQFFRGEDMPSNTENEGGKLTARSIKM